MLYKYRDLKKIEWIEDIIRQNRLYASVYTKLNDPMEGIFRHRGLHKDILKKLKTDKGNLRICSLSEKYDDTLMWSHYANGERGIVIGINNDIHLAQDVIPIRYEGIPTVETDNITAMEILSFKKPEWAYEHEVRAFTLENFISVKIEEIILGRRIDCKKELRIRELVEEVNSINPNNKIRIEKLENVLFRA